MGDGTVASVSLAARKTVVMVFQASTSERRTTFMNPGKTIRIAVLLGLLCCAAGSASAQTNYYWDPTGTNSTNGGGSGTWDTNTSTNWWVSGPTDSQWTDTSGTATAVFGGAAGAYTVTVSGNNTANGLTFNAAGYTLSGGTVTLAGTSPTIAANASATIDSSVMLAAAQTWTTAPGQTLAANGPLSYASAATLTLGGSGTTVLGAGNVLGSGANGLTVNSGTLALASTGIQNTYANQVLTINAGAVVQSYGQLNLNVDQNGSTGSTNITGAGTLQLAATGSSRAAPDLYFGPDHSGNSYWGAAINVATLDLGNTQRYIDANTGHNSVSQYYTSTWTDARISSNIIGSGGITFYAGSQHGGQYAELLLSGSNSFSGPVEVDRGAVFLDNPNALTQANAVTLSNSDGTFSNFFLLGNNATISNLQSAGATPGNTSVANGNPKMHGPAQVVNPVTLTVNQTANTTFAGTIADTASDGYDGGSLVPGPLSLVKTGTASLTITGTNTYTGGTAVNAGILGFGDMSLSTGPVTLNGASGLRWINNADDITSINGLQLADNARATLDTNGNNVTLNGAITGGSNGGVLIKAGPGALVLNGATSYNGGTTIAGGSILFTSTSFPATGLITLTGGAVQVAGPYTTVTAWLASNRIDPASTGALALTADSSENINMAGYPTLSLGAATGASVNYTGTLTPANPGTWYLGGGGGQITFPNLVLSGSVNAVLGSGDLGGSGTVAFPDSSNPSQTNTYTGTTTINGGLVEAPVLANGGQPSTIGRSSNAASNLILNGGGIQYTGPGASTDRVFSLGINGGVLNASGTGPLVWTNTAAVALVGGSGPRTLTLQGVNTGANTLALALGDGGGPTSLVMNGPATWLLTAANTYTGPTTLASGTLVVPTIANGGAPSAIGASSNDPANLVFNGGTLQYTGPGATSDRGFTLNPGGATFDIEGPTLTLSGPVIGTGLGVGLTKIGPGTLVLAGPINFYSPTMVNAGTLAFLSNVNTDANTVITVNSGAVFQSGATLNLDVDQNGSGSSTNVAGQGTLQLVSTGSSAAAPDIFFGPDHSGNSYYGAAIGVATLDLGNAQRYFSANSGHNSFAIYDTEVDAYVSSNIIGSGGITYTGYAYNGSATNHLFAELVLAGSNSFSGPVEINQGAIFLDSPSALTQANAVTLSSSANGWSHLFLTGNNATISNLQSAGPAPGNTAVANGTISMVQTQVANPVTLTINQTANTTFAGVIADAVTDNYDAGSSGTPPGPLSLVLSGLNTASLTLTGSNAYSGTTTLNGGVLNLTWIANGGAVSPLGISSNAASNLLLAGGTLQYTGGGDSTDRLFTLDSAGGAIAASGTGPLVWTNAGTINFSGSGPRTLTLCGANTGANTLGITLTDGSDAPTSLVKTGPGTWILSPSNTYTGPTTVRQGVLQINGGSSLASPLALDGGTLFVNNPLAAGPTQTTLFGTGFTVSSPSTLTFQAGTTWDTSTPLLSGQGALTVNSTATINLASFGSLGVGDYPLIALNGGSLGGTLGLSGLVLGSLPPRVQATLAATNQGGVEMLDLDITAFDTIKWTGAVSSAWDTTTQNWQTVITHMPTTYIDQPKGDSVTFDDSASSGTVNLASIVQPSGVTVNNNTLNYTFSSSTGTGGISGNTFLTKSGNANLTLATSNTYTGGTLINGGTLTLGNGVTPAAGSISGDVSLDNSVTGTAVLQFNRPDTVTFPGNISGNGSLVQAGPGTLIVTGSNTYAGSTVVSGGTLQVGNGGPLGIIPTGNSIVNNAALVFDSNAVVTLVNTISGTGTTYVNGGTLQLGDGTNVGSISGPVVTNATLALNLPGTSQTYSGVISGGSGGVVVVGSPTIVFTASNGYTGSTYIGGGDLIFGNVANIGSPKGTGSVIVDGGTVEYTGSSGTTAHGLTVNAGGATVQVDNAGQTLTLSGPVTGSGGLNVTGPGNLTLSGSINLEGTGSQVNGTQVNGGTLSVGNMNTYANSPLIINSGAVVQSAATLNLNVVQNGGNVGSTNVSGSGTLQLTATGSSRAAPDIFFGPDHSGNSYWGAAIEVATLDLGNSQRYIDANSGHNSVAVYYSTGYTDARISSSIIGSGGITFYSGLAYGGQYAELVLAGSNTFSGPVEVDQGAIFLDNPLALSQSNALTLANSSTDSQSFSHFFLFGNNVTISNLQSAGTKPGQTGIANGTPMMAADDALTPVTNAVMLTINQTANTTFAGTIADALSDNYNSGSIVPGSLSLLKTGPAALVLSGTDTYSGSTEVGAGALIVTNGMAIPAGSALTVDAGASFIFDPSAASAPVLSSASAAAPVPEPSTLVLLSIGAMATGLGVWRRTAVRRWSKTVN